jgi:hypothetical protein
VLLNDGLRVTNVDPGKAPEIVSIEGEDTRHPVNLHCRGKACIVNLEAGHGLRPHEAFPLFVRTTADGFVRLLESTAL